MNATIKTDQTLYLLLGEQAVDGFAEGFKYFKKDIKNHQYDFELAIIKDGDSLMQVLNAIDGFFGYEFISEEAYNQLLDFYNKLHPENLS
jgi:hypothetical protein